MGDQPCAFQATTNKLEFKFIYSEHLIIKLQRWSMEYNNNMHAYPHTHIYVNNIVKL